MKVQVLYFEGCPNYEPTVTLVRDVLRALGVSAQVEPVEVKNADEANRLRFLGSPSVQVDGVDIEPDARSRTDYAFCCRMYGSAGVPSRELVEAALKALGGIGSESHAGCSAEAASARTQPQSRGERTGLWAAAGSVVSASVASACCWLPLLLIAFGASAAGVSAMFDKVRPVFLAAAAVLLGVGFYVVYFRKEVCAPGSACAVPNPRGKRFNQTMLWTAAVVVVAFAFFPSYGGLLLGNARAPAAVEPGAARALAALNIEGMTCEACAVHVQRALTNVPGVLSAAVVYAERKARVVYDPAKAAPETLTQATAKAGYPSSVESTVIPIGG